jgi:outer membrane biogenesis lipoprotein LolB
MIKISVMAIALLLLAACGEREQTISSSYKPDQKAWQSGATPYAANGYKAGDKARWDQQLRDRNQVQNEYLRVN